MFEYGISLKYSVHVQGTVQFGEIILCFLTVLSPSPAAFIFRARYLRNFKFHAFFLVEGIAMKSVKLVPHCIKQSHSIVNLYLKMTYCLVKT